MRLPLLFLGMLLWTGIGGGAAWAQQPETTSQTYALRGRRILLTNLNQAVTLSADELTSFVAAQGLIDIDPARPERVVRVRVRVTNRALQPADAVHPQLVLASGAALPEEEKLTRALESYSSGTLVSQDRLEPAQTRTISHIYRVPEAQVDSALVHLPDRGVTLTMPLQRLLSLTAQRRVQ